MLEGARDDILNRVIIAGCRQCKSLEEQIFKVTPCGARIAPFQCPGYLRLSVNERSTNLRRKDLPELSDYSFPLPMGAEKVELQHQQPTSRRPCRRVTGPPSEKDGQMRRKINQKQHISQVQKQAASGINQDTPYVGHVKFMTIQILGSLNILSKFNATTEPSFSQYFLCL